MGRGVLPASWREGGERVAEETHETSESAQLAVAGGGTEIAGPAQHVVDPEQAVAEFTPVEDTQREWAVWLYRPDQPPQRIEIGEIAELISHEDNLVWVDLLGSFEEDLRRIAPHLNLDPLELEVALSSWQRPRLDLYDDHYFVGATVASLDPEQYRVYAGQLNLLVGHNYLLTAHVQPMPFFQRVQARAQGNPELVRLDSAFMLYIILDELLAHYEGLMEQIQSETESVEERALTDLSDEFLPDLLHFKRYVSALHQLAGQHRAVFAAFLRPDFQFVSGEEVVPYFRDLGERLDYLLAALVSARDAINGAFDIYISHASHRTNQVMRVLTIVSTTLLPLTVIIAFFGTSFRSLPELYSGGGFIAMLFIASTVTSGILLAFHRKGWL